MNEVQETIGKIYNLLSAVPVRGDDVETLAAARALLRDVYRQTEETREGKDGG